MTLCKIIFIWLLCGFLSIPLVIRYGNKQPISLMGMIFLVGSGPIALTVYIAGMLLKETPNPCIINCGELK